MSPSSDPLLFFVELEFTHSLGPDDGLYQVRAQDGDVDVLSLRTVGAPFARPRLIRRERAKPVEGGGDPRPVPVAVATVLEAGRRLAAPEARREYAALVDDEADAERRIARAIVVVNEAIRTYRMVASDPYALEVTRRDPRAIRIGIGGSEAILAARWEAAFEPAPPRVPRTDRTERIKPSERLADVLAGRTALPDAVDLALRAALDLEQSRPDAARAQLRAAIDSLGGGPAAGLESVARSLEEGDGPAVVDELYRAIAALREEAEAAGAPPGRGGVA